MNLKATSKREEMFSVHLNRNLVSIIDELYFCKSPAKDKMYWSLPSTPLHYLSTKILPTFASSQNICSFQLFPYNKIQHPTFIQYLQMSS